MGVWGSGLYSGDFALDLRSSIAAVCRLPFDSDRLLELLCQNEPDAASDRNHEDHTTFWLVVADQFARRGIDAKRARDEALAIIESGADIALHEKLGMDPAGLRSRRKMLEELHTRISAPLTTRPRTTLKKPQPLLMGLGDVFVYPVFGSRPRNPYFANKEQDKMGTQAPSWSQDAWAAMVIVDCGRAFEYLSWYRPVTLCMAMREKPALEVLLGEVLWKLSRPGTCSAVHFKRMELEKIGSLAIDREKLEGCFPGMKPGIVQAVQDISIVGGLHVAPCRPMEAISTTQLEAQGPVAGTRDKTIVGVGQILAG